MSQMKLLAVDLDRTCLDSRDQVRQSTLDALRAAVAAGVSVVIATGRNLLGIPKVLRELPGVRYAITSNGAAIFDLASGKAIYEKCIPMAQAAALLRAAEEMNIPRSVTVGPDVIDTTPEVYEIRHTFFHDYAESLYAENLVSYLQERGEEPAKLHFLYMRKYDSAPIYERLRAEPGIAFTGDLTGHTEVVAEGVDKGAALAQLAEGLGISREETAAVGDSDNDVTMLRWAALSVAMGGAPNHVRAAARFQTADCDHDGLARAVEMLLSPQTSALQK